MPRVGYCYYCYSWGSEVERYEFTECKSCHEFFCEDCVDENALCDQCHESAVHEGGAWLLNRSLGLGRNVAAAQLTKLSALECVCITPFGTPVEPEVYKM